jgi:hypothetical protein
MGGIERRSSAPKPYEGYKASEQRDPTEWSDGTRDWERVDHNVEATAMRSEPLNYGTLVGDNEVVSEVGGKILGIEANARAQLVAMMERHGITPDERGIRTHWQLVTEGYGFKMPEGFVHPEAPPEVKQQGREAWKRVVEIASDSVSKFLFVKVWRRKQQRIRPPEEKRELLSRVRSAGGGQRMGGIEIVRTGEEDVVDAEIVEDDVEGEPEDVNDL